MRIGILIVSDRASIDVNYDKSGPAIRSFIADRWPLAQIVKFAIVPDDKVQIKDQILSWTDCPLNIVDGVQLLITSGGTGFSSRDVTPEAVREVIERDASGLTTLIMQKSIEITPFAALSRPVCGIRNSTVILTLPGSPKACRENLEIVQRILPHAVQLASSTPDNVSSIQHPPLASSDNIVSSSTSAFDRKISKGCRCDHESSDPTASVVSNSSRLRKSKYPMISYEQALAIIQFEVQPQPIGLNDQHERPQIEIKRSQFDQLDGHVLAAAVYSPTNVPAYDSSYVDGYAALHPCRPGKYTVSHSIVAGGRQLSDIGIIIDVGQVVRVNTGSVIPRNTGCIVMVEDTLLVESTGDGDESVIEIFDSSSLSSSSTLNNDNNNNEKCEGRWEQGENIRKCGSDVAKGQLLFEAGHRFDSLGFDLGILISTGVQSVRVHKKPRIGIISSGNEVRSYLDSGNLESGCIWDTNGPCLKKLLEHSGFETVSYGIVSDDVDLLTEGLRRAMGECDVVITTGGVSMGEKDFIKPILEERLNTTIHFGRVNLKPGKPTTFATGYVDGLKKYVFGLPGNPVSCSVTCKLFVLPLLKGLSGVQGSQMILDESEVISVQVGADIQLDSRPEFARAALKQKDAQGAGRINIAEIDPNQKSSRLLSMKNANLLVKLPPGTGMLKKGAVADAILFR